MPLKSVLFSADPRHLACQTRDSAHYVPGMTGTHIADVQAVLNLLDNLVIENSEREAQRYGPSTAAAVLAFKRKRKIVNHAYQTAEDSIVGKMTITALDDEMAAFEASARALSTDKCPSRNARGTLFARSAVTSRQNGLTLTLLTDEERDVIA
jgi:peptidoglycan hydrolase-like protein with peptidoglycan-binding domain